MELSILLEKMFVFLAELMIGYVLARRGVLDRNFTRTASSLTFNVFLVATVFHSAVSLEAQLSLLDLCRLMLVILVMLAIGCVTAALAARVLPIDRDHKPEFELLTNMGNVLFVGLPIANALYGAQGAFYVALCCIPFNAVVYTYGVLRFKSDSEDRRLRLKDMISMPLIATLLSLPVILLRPPVPGALRSLLSSMSGATMPLSMIVIGATLGPVSILDAFKRGQLYLASALRLLVIPLLTWLIMRNMGLSQELLMTLVIVSACPGPVVVTVLAIQYGRDSVYTAESTLQSTLLSMATIPLLLWLLN